MNFKIKKPTNFSEEIRQIQTQDLVHPNSINPQLETLIHNDIYLKKEVEELEEKQGKETGNLTNSINTLELEIKQHQENQEKHIQQEEREKLAGIEEKANNYTHPATHSAGIITETHERKFVSVEQWNKLNALFSNAQMSARLSKNGWYQILAIEAENQETVNGAGGFSAILQISTGFSHNNNMSIIIACTISHNARDIQVISKSGNASAATAYPALRWARYANSQVLELNYTGSESGNIIHVVPLQWATYEWQSIKLKNLVLSNTTPTGTPYTVDLTKKAGVLELKEEISRHYLPVTASCNKNWNWVGQTGQPTWLWGGIDAANMYVYNPSNFNVDMVDGKHAADLLNYNNLTNKPSTFPPTAHNQSASTITAGRFLAQSVQAVDGTDYTTSRIRNIFFGTATPSVVPSGAIYFQYE